MQIEPWMWAAFVGFILAMLTLDLFVVHKDAHEVSFREAATWSIIWVALGLSFGILIWVWRRWNTGWTRRHRSCWMRDSSTPASPSRSQRAAST